MRKGGGKAKGASFEREICKKLSLWVSKGELEDIFWRSAMSGGRSTVALTKGKTLASQAGDISCINPIGEPFNKKFFCECKHYADLNFPGLIRGVGHLTEFWKIACTQAALYGKQPFLIAKQNRFPTVICLTGDGLATLRIKRFDIQLIAPKIDLYLMEEERFFKNVLPFGG